MREADAELEARAALSALRGASAPSGKLDCICRAVSVLASCGRRGADDVLHMLVQAMLRSDVRAPHAEARFVAAFVHDGIDLAGSAGYCLACFQAAAEAAATLSLEVLLEAPPAVQQTQTRLEAEPILPTEAPNEARADASSPIDGGATPSEQQAPAMAPAAAAAPDARRVSEPNGDDTAADADARNGSCPELTTSPPAHGPIDTRPLESWHPWRPSSRRHERDGEPASPGGAGRDRRASLSLAETLEWMLEQGEVAREK